jgi:hypothetical protein
MPLQKIVRLLQVFRLRAAAESHSTAAHCPSRHPARMRTRLRGRLRQSLASVVPRLECQSVAVGALGARQDSGKRFECRDNGSLARRRCQTRGGYLIGERSGLRVRARYCQISKLLGLVPTYDSVKTLESHDATSRRCRDSQLQMTRLIAALDSEREQFRSSLEIVDHGPCQSPLLWR